MAPGLADASEGFSLYVHVPFCTRTCPYCNFYQVPYREDREEPFVEAALREGRILAAELNADGRWVETLYWGGGTPSLLSPCAIRELAAGIRATFELRPELEFTVEANPGELPIATLRALAAAGTNRLSLGCQSFQPDRLIFLGRWHTAEQNREAVAAARAEGFENLSLDLIFNLPPELGNQGWHADVEEALALAPEHVSVYGLTLEPRTVFGQQAERGRLALLEPEGYAAQYLWAAERLAAAGYDHYETSSFALPGRESAHNRRYWSGADYLGLGPGAHSFWAGRRWANPTSLERWRAAVLAGRPSRELDDRAGPGSLYAERAYLGLRWRRGLATHELEGDPERIRAFVRELGRAGLAEQGGDRVVLTDKGHLVLDEIVSRLLDLSDRCHPTTA